MNRPDEEPCNETCSTCNNDWPERIEEEVEACATDDDVVDIVDGAMNLRERLESSDGKLRDAMAVLGNQRRITSRLIEHKAQFLRELEQNESVIEFLQRRWDITRDLLVEQGLSHLIPLIDGRAGKGGEYHVETR